jgi:hypothetical protein
MVEYCTKFLFALALCISLTQSSARAQHDESRHPLRLYLGPGFGFGGESETDAEVAVGAGGIGFGLELDGEEDLITTLGAQFGAEYVLHRYFALGGEFRFSATNTEGGDDADFDRSMLYDIDLKPRVRYPLASVPLELYFTLPVGLTIPRLSDDLSDRLDDRLDENIGWNLGIGAGLTYFLTSRIGINLEPMWLMHWFSVEARAPLISSDVDFRLRQFRLFANLVIAL